jgi:hypothetical protein
MTAQLDAVTLAQAEERLRQERELFDLKKAQDQKSFSLRLAIGRTTIALFVAICAFSGFIIINNDDFSSGTVTAASSALLVEALGLVGAIIKGTMGAAPKELEPTTALPVLPPAELDSA